MSSEQVRPVIECFCQILSSYGFSTITSEIFRLAKFDQNEATVPLWRLLYEMIHIDSDKISQNKFDQTPKDEIVDIIKRDLYKRGYTYDYFLSLDNNMQEGSRHLLVCVGWLIYHVKLIEKCMKQCLNSISNPTEIVENDKCDLIEQIKQALHSNSKIRSCLRAIEHKNPEDNHPMSSFESQLCQYPHLITQYLTELDNEHYKLNLFLFWNKHEDIFWKWMESVLDQPTTIAENNELLHEIDCQHLEAEKQKFNAAIDTLDSALVRLEQLWISNDDHASIENDVSSIVASIDKQISSLFNKLLDTNSVFIKQSVSE
ncbi:unnamed protein product [Adineta steineri]|uniref:Tubulin epsilon and delta complex protein 1 domain-containing protein n=1 Tax=Adineta steineri TaxID=433720 RepID=A0A814H727_9BILA|nr:unnamed protein product [Adineta steineri]CAF4029497.1 unnamed protein product [Adineta steineri]